MSTWTPKLVDLENEGKVMTSWHSSGFAYCHLSTCVAWWAIFFCIYCISMSPWTWVQGHNKLTVLQLPIATYRIYSIISLASNISLPRIYPWSVADLKEYNPTVLCYSNISPPLIDPWGQDGLKILLPWGYIWINTVVLSICTINN